MKWALEGGHVTDANPIPTDVREMWREYRFARLFGLGVPFDEFDAAKSEWFLAFAELEANLRPHAPAEGPLPANVRRIRMR